MTKFSVVLPDGTVHTIDGSSLRVEFDDDLTGAGSGIQDIPFTEIVSILTTINAGQQISNQMNMIESVGNIGPVQEDELEELDEKLSDIIAGLFGMPSYDEESGGCHDGSCGRCETPCHDSDYDDNAGEADGSNPIEAVKEAIIIQFPRK